MEQSTRIDVEAPVEQVWEVLREVERWPEWASTVTSVRRLDDGPLAVGSRVRVEQPRIPPTEDVVTELEPGRSFIWVATGPGVRATARHLLEDLGTGGTRVTLTVEQAGPVGRVMGRFVAAQYAVTPPSTASASADVQVDSSDSRYRTACEISTGSMTLSGWKWA
ncbi:Polyketide cyclase / dehydrase and lipid transport [Geodermatophilus sabuli]|uniref:Polyketide cyclase / dehydrase and lipid transport n=1 Tax=Geodermatophilus sabuli TaxID=1564158 RepID=A0A285E6E4_9ACTN|nr:Polyketide cyclase / dehydrase and lipid transport [Geodermatophilus sabuli]